MRKPALALYYLASFVAPVKPRRPATRENDRLLGYSITIMIASVVFLMLLSALVPWQAATNPTSRPANVDKESTSNKKTTAPSPVPSPPTANKTEAASNTPASESEPRRVIIVSGPSKDRWDKVYIWLTGALVFIGLLTLGAIWFQAVKTRDAAEATRDQATQTASAATSAANTVTEIKKQTDILGKQVEATNRNLDLIISKERAQIRLLPLEFETNNSIVALPSVQYKVLCYGTTKASVTSQRGHVEVTDSPEPCRTEAMWPLQLDPVVIPNLEGVQHSIPILSGMTPKMREGVYEGRLFLHFWGLIEYKDFSETKRTHPFRYILKVPQNFPRKLDGTPYTYWEKCGQPEDNQDT